MRESRRLWLWVLFASLIAVVVLPVRAAEVDAAKGAIKRGAKLVDVRTPQEFAAGHLEGAVNIPLDVVQKSPEQVGPKDKAVVVYCRSGHRSGMAKQRLLEAGFKEVYDLGAMSNG
ncbi:MAG: rhodanese-like domain-containing protein [Myxococcota bacterium]